MFKFKLPQVFEALVPDRKRAVVLGRQRNLLLPKRELLTEREMNLHTHVVGASGFGKTVLISHILRKKIELGSGMLYIDLKGDRETINGIRSMAEKAGRSKDVLIFSISDQSISTGYDLLKNGTPTQLRDRIVSSLVWTEEYYKNQAASFLLRVLVGLCRIREETKCEIGIPEILKAASDPSFLEEKYLQLKKIDLDRRVLEIFEGAVSFISDRDNFKSLQGLRSQLESLVYSDFGKLIAPLENGIDLFRAVQDSKIVMVLLDSRRYGETAKTLGRFLLQDLKATSARIDADVPAKDRRPFSVIIDEFADLAQEDFIGFLDRARSSKMSILVAHQELCDLQRISPEFAGRLMGNMSNLYSFLQKRPESAELIAGIAGTRTVTKETRQVDSILGINIFGGKKSLREVEEYMIHPNLIKCLPVGRCVSIKKFPKATAAVVDVFPG